MPHDGSRQRGWRKNTLQPEAIHKGRKHLSWCLSSGSYNWSLCPTTFPFPTDPGSRESKAWMSNDQWEFQPVNSMSGLAVTGCRCNCSFGLEAPRWTSIGILLGFMGIYSHFLPPQSPWPAVQTIGQSVMGFCASPSQLSGKKRLINHRHFDRGVAHGAGVLRISSSPVLGTWEFIFP